MLELLKSTRKFDVENLKKVNEKTYVNYSEKNKRYTFYYIYNEGHIAEKHVSIEEYEMMKMFDNL